MLQVEPSPLLPLLVLSQTSLTGRLDHHNATVSFCRIKQVTNGFSRSLGSLIRLCLDIMAAAVTADLPGQLTGLDWHNLVQNLLQPARCRCHGQQQIKTSGRP